MVKKRICVVQKSAASFGQLSTNLAYIMPLAGYNHEQSDPKQQELVELDS